MKIRVIQGFSVYTPGQVFDDWPDGMCEIFIAKGLIERVGEPPEGGSPDLKQEVKRLADTPAVESADVSQEVERAELPAKRRKK